MSGLSACDKVQQMPDAGDMGSVPVYDLTVDLRPPSCISPATFSAIKSEILKFCDGSGDCHRVAPFAAGLDLTDAAAYSSLVNAPAKAAPALVRVKPGSPADSFLWHKLDNELPADGSQGQPMPLGAEFIWYPLKAAQRAQVYCWIQAGAQDN